MKALGAATLARTTQGDFGKLGPKALEPAPQQYGHRLWRVIAPHEGGDALLEH